VACYEIALGYYYEKSYDSAAVYIRKAVDCKQMSEQARVLMGTIFDEAKMPDSALACYKTALQFMPYNSKLLYDIGCTYYRLDSLDLAEDFVIQAIKINPTYYKATFMLGALNEKRNRRVEALLCYYMAALINPSAELVRTVELYLGGESEIAPLVKEYVPTSPSFEKIEEYIDAKIAMTAKYKPIFKSKSAFARQGDILFKYLEFDPKADNFYMNFYVKLFTLMRDKKQVETAMYVYFSGFNIESVQKWVKSNSSKVTKFYGAVKDEITRLSARGFVNDANYQGMNYVYADGVLSEFGKYSDEKNKVREGLWIVVEPDGWVSTTVNYKNGKPDGEVNGFNSNGQLIGSISVVNGIKSGVQKMYYNNGQLQWEAFYENSKLNGKLTRYYFTGQKQGEENYRNDLLEDEMIYYYLDGKISQQGNFVKDNPIGKWIDYHPNGSISTINFYSNKGNLPDTASYFDANGVLTSVFVYSNNGKNIQKIYFRPNGSVYTKEEVKNENLIKIESFDTIGNVLETTNISNAGTYVKYRNWFGNVSSEGMLKNGNADGRWVYYGLFGNIRQVSWFKQGEQYGADTSFYPNGKIKIIGNNKNGKHNGYATQYNQAGKVTDIWYYANDEPDQWQQMYSVNGNLDFETYYSNHLLREIIQYDSTGKVYERLTIPDSACTIVLHPPIGTRAEEHYIGCVRYGITTYFDAEEYSKYPYFNGMLYDTVKFYNLENILTDAIPYMENERHGLASYYTQDGELAYQLLYYRGATIECISPRNNQRIPIENDKKITTYFANGAKSAEMTFVNGYREGEFTRYYSNGKLSSKSYYEAGELNGIYQEFYSNGKLKKEVNYVYDEQVGVIEY
jgi:antitoxin component YwqK of YwqJK toxin-antitoxin module/Tfp pilus assembly protein PilF